MKNLLDLSNVKCSSPLFGLATLVITLVTSNAVAVPITGSIDILGTGLTDSGNIGTADAITSYLGPFGLHGTQPIVGLASGDYAETTLSLVTMTPFTFDTFGAAVEPLWSFT